MYIVVELNFEEKLIASQRPHVHSTEESALKEAERLTAITSHLKQSSFVVFKAISISKMAAPPIVTMRYEDNKE